MLKIIYHTNDLDNYKIHPSNIKDIVRNDNNINHLVEK